MASAVDIPLLIKSQNASSERRISPAWSIAHLKERLEPITGVPSTVQELRLSGQMLYCQDEETTQFASFAPQAYAELEVTDSRPKSLQTNYNDVSAVEKYEMPVSEYEALPNSVLAWKKTQKLGRFDPQAGTADEQKIAAVQREIEERHIAVGARCQLLPASDARRGQVSYVGDIKEIPGLGAWIGITLDEPTGKNDGSVHGVRYFNCQSGHGIFVRPERIEVGDFSILDELGDEFEEL